MDDYISKTEAFDIVRFECGEWSGLAKTICKRFDYLPHADVQPVRHGHWILCEEQSKDDVDNGNYLYVCSNCNHSDIHAKTVDVPYCWHCGTRMDGDTDG